MFYIPPLPFLDSALDLATLSFIAALLLLSLLSTCFILYLHIKSRSSHYLQHFNSFWTVRFLLVSFITLWALNELLRVPLFHRRYLYPFLPNITLPQQATLCQIHVVLSLGLLEPGFLATLLFLLDVSIKKKSPRGSYAVAFVLTSCLPILAIQILFLFLSGFEIRLPELFQRSFSIAKDRYGHDTVLCTYPLLSTISFGAFGAIYLLSFLVSSWRVASLVINKALRIRMYFLAFTVMTTLPLQILCMGLSVLWRPESAAFGGVAQVVFLSTFTCAAVGEGILVIRPISDSLAVGADFCRWAPEERSDDQSSRHVEEADDGINHQDHV